MYTLVYYYISNALCPLSVLLSLIHKYLPVTVTELPLYIYSSPPLLLSYLIFLYYYMNSVKALREDI